MICWHKWTKWSEPEFKTIEKIYSYYPRVVESRELVQERTCKKCSKYKWRTV